MNDIFVRATHETPKNIKTKTPRNDSSEFFIYINRMSVFVNAERNNHILFICSDFFNILADSNQNNIC